MNRPTSSSSRFEENTSFEGADVTRIAIDGGGGAGKGRASKEIAMDRDFIALDTGAAYRIIAVLVDRAPGLLMELKHAQHEAVLNTLKMLDLHYAVDGELHLNGASVEPLIRTREIGKLVPDVSPIPVVRDYVHYLLRQAADMAEAAGKGIVAEGRDMGTVVFPDADLKIFFNTPVEVRAKRRLKQLQEMGNTTITYEEVLADLIERDRKDTERENDPLRPAEDAVIIDTSTIPDVAGAYAQLVHDILAERVSTHPLPSMALR